MLPIVGCVVSVERLTIGDPLVRLENHNYTIRTESLADICAASVLHL